MSLFTDQDIAEVIGLAQVNGAWDETVDYLYSQYRLPTTNMVTHENGLYVLIGQPDGTPPGQDSAWSLIADIGGAGPGGGIGSINGNQNTVQTIVGTGITTVSSTGGVTTIHTPLPPSITSINGDTTTAQTIVGIGAATVTSVGGVTTVSVPAGADGITSINGSEDAAQLIVGSGGTIVNTVGNTTTITSPNALLSINGSTAQAQTIQGGGITSVISLSGVTTVTTNALQSINGNTVAAQTIVGTGGTTVSSVGGVTTINSTAISGDADTLILNPNITDISDMSQLPDGLSIVLVAAPSPFSATLPYLVTTWKTDATFAVQQAIRSGQLSDFTSRRTYTSGAWTSVVDGYIFTATQRTKLNALVVGKLQPYNTLASYAVNDITNHDGTIFLCTEATPNPAGVWDPSKWTYYGGAPVPSSPDPAPYWLYWDGATGQYAWTTTPEFVQITVNGDSFLNGNVTGDQFIGPLTGTASGNTTYTPNNHGVVLSSTNNTMTVLAPAGPGLILTSNGGSADPSWELPDGGVTTIGTLSIAGTDPNAATITGDTLTLQAASAVGPGVLTSDTGTIQQIEGPKEFLQPLTLTGITHSLPLKTDAGGVVLGAAIDLSGLEVTGILPNSKTTAVSTNTSSAIVARDGSGNFSAGNITASLTGTASGNTTYAPNNHGVVLSSATNAMTVIAPVSQTDYVLTSNGLTSDPTWQAPAARITSINADTTAAQVIVGSGVIAANTSSGTTTISSNQFISYNASTNTPSLASLVSGGIYKVATEGIQTVGGASSFCAVGDLIVNISGTTSFLSLSTVSYNATTGATLGGTTATPAQLAQDGRNVYISTAGTQVGFQADALDIGNILIYTGGVWQSTTLQASNTTWSDTSTDNSSAISASALINIFTGTGRTGTAPGVIQVFPGGYKLFSATLVNPASMPTPGTAYPATYNFPGGTFTSTPTLVALGTGTLTAAYYNAGLSGLTSTSITFNFTCGVANPATFNGVRFVLFGK